MENKILRLHYTGDVDRTVKPAMRKYYCDLTEEMNEILEDKCYISQPPNGIIKGFELYSIRNDKGTILDFMTDKDKTISTIKTHFKDYIEVGFIKRDTALKLKQIILKYVGAQLSL